MTHTSSLMFSKPHSNCANGSSQNNQTHVTTAVDGLQDVFSKPSIPCFYQFFRYIRLALHKG
jgi:hypothetical protein